VALAVLATLAVKGGERSKPDLARDLVDVLAERFPDRRIDLVADAAYGAGSFAGLGHDMTITTRARSNAAFSEPTPPRTGKRGRPLRPARPPEHRHRAASGHRAVVPVEDRTLDPGHAHHPPPPNHRHPISAPIAPTSHNPGNPRGPASLDSSEELSRQMALSIHSATTATAVTTASSAAASSAVAASSAAASSASSAATPATAVTTTTSRRSAGIWIKTARPTIVVRLTPVVPLDALPVSAWGTVSGMLGLGSLTLLEEAHGKLLVSMSRTLSSTISILD